MNLHNTMTGAVEPVTPLEASVIKLYTCGLTVYSQPHIGNWLGYIYWDVLVRVLEHDGFTVERTQNITDVGHLTSDDDAGEDKMQAGATREGTSAWDIADKYIAIADHEAYELLQLRRPTHLVRATEYIAEQIAFAARLESAGLTYFIENEGLYFDTSKLKEYGQLARLDAAGLQAGKRVAVSGKRLATDFAIWKLSPQSATRDMEWESPWGVGFPGWHLECSVIAYETLGPRIDIHTGGIDHIPVHHTNEIAQTEGVTSQPFATTWVHNNHLKINGAKISKSLGNTVTLQDILDRGFDMQAFKLFALSKQYRTEGNFDWTIMKAAANRYERWKSVATLRHQIHATSDVEHMVSPQAAIEAIHQALTDDLNTPKAVALIDEAFDSITNISLTRIDRHGLVALLEAIDELLGINLSEVTPDVDDTVKQLLLERSRARENNDWATSDQLRDTLRLKGIVVNDSAKGTTWHYSE